MNDHDLDRLLRRAAERDPVPVSLEPRVRRTLADAARGERRRTARRTVLAVLGPVAAVAGVAVLAMLPTLAPGPPPPTPDAADADTAVVVTRTPMLGADPDDIDPEARLIDAGTSIPVALASDDPDITIVWLLPGSPDPGATDDPDSPPTELTP